MSAAAILRTDGSWIQKRPDVCGGDACIRETRLPVWSIVAAQRRGVSDTELLEYFVTPLSSADLAAARQYYELHRQEVDADIRANEED